MKVIAKGPFLDENGLHKPGDIVEVKNFTPGIMELIAEKDKKEIVETATKKEPKKTTRKKV
jgi:hypothetical protein